MLAKLQDDAGLREKLKGAADLDAAAAMAQEAGFDVSKADWLKHQAKQTLKLSDDELEKMSGGIDTFGNPKNPGNSVKYACDWTLKGSDSDEVWSDPVTAAKSTGDGMVSRNC